MPRRSSTDANREISWFHRAQNTSSLCSGELIRRPHQSNLIGSTSSTLHRSASSWPFFSRQIMTVNVHALLADLLVRVHLADRDELTISNSQCCRSQPESIGNHGDRAEAHGRRGDHRVQKQPEKREQHSCGNRHTDCIVNKREEQILSDVTHG